MATHYTRNSATRSRTSSRRSPARSAIADAGTRRVQSGDARRLRVPAAEAHRLRSMLLSDDVGLIGSQDIRKLVTILEDTYPAPRSRRSPWQPLLVGIGLGLMILAGIILVS